MIGTIPSRPIRGLGDFDQAARPGECVQLVADCGPVEPAQFGDGCRVEPEPLDRGENEQVAATIGERIKLLRDQIPQRLGQSQYGRGRVEAFEGPCEKGRVPVGEVGEFAGEVRRCTRKPEGDQVGDRLRRQTEELTSLDETVPVPDVSQSREVLPRWMAVVACEYQAESRASVLAQQLVEDEQTAFVAVVEVVDDHDGGPTAKSLGEDFSDLQVKSALERGEAVEGHRAGVECGSHRSGGGGDELAGVGNRLGDEGQELSASADADSRPFA